MKPQTYQEVERRLKEVGFAVDRSSGSHFIWRNASTGKTAVVPHHNRPLPIGTLLAIYRQSGICP